MMMLNDILPRFGGKKAALARSLGITKQAVSRWDPDKPIPEGQALKLKCEILPQLRKERDDGGEAA